MERKLLLLGILRQQEMHGYQLYEYIDKALSACTDMTKPTAYYILNKMADEGWISEELTQEGNRPPRKVYRLTPLGEAEFQHLLRENLAHFTPVNFPDVIGLAFLDLLPVEESNALLKQRREELKEALQAAQSTPTHPGSLQWVVKHQIDYLTWELDWVDQLIKEKHAS